jgi:uncharacterized membrane protein YjjP (DUF1212 family)
MEDLYSFVMPLGFATWILLLVTMLIGLRVLKVKFKFHKILAIVTFLVATAHGLLVWYLNNAE